MFDGTFHEFEDNHENKSLEHLQLLKRSLDQIEWRLQQKLNMLNREYRRVCWSNWGPIEI